MRQGRKSKTVVVLGCSLLVFAGCLAIAPGFAAAQAADEYTPGELPDPDSDEPGAAGGSSGSGGDSSGSAPPPVSPGSGDSGTDPTATAPVTDGEGNSGDEGGGSQGDDKGENKGEGEGQGSGANDRDRAGDGSTKPDAATPALTSSSSDDGGAPVLLIVLAVVAAVCTGLAIWRMRRGDVADREAAQAKSGGGRVHGETSSL